MKSYKELLLFLPLIFPGALSVKGQNVPLISPNQNLTLTSKRISFISQNVMGNEMTMHSETSMNFDVMIKKSIPGDIHITAAIKHLIVNGNAMGKQLNFNSDRQDDLASESGIFFKDVLSKSYEFDISEKSKIFKINNESMVSNKAEDAILSLLIGNIGLELPYEMMFSTYLNKIGDTTMEK